MIYSIVGFGKGKTESAIGIAVRAMACGDDVLFVQFLKDGTSSEIDYFKNIPNIYTLFGIVDKITLPQNLTTIDKFKAQSLFCDVWERARGYNLVVVDEILPAVDMGLITLEQLEELVELCNANNIDLYMTGRVRQKSLRVKIAAIS